MMFKALAKVDDEMSRMLVSALFTCGTDSTHVILNHDLRIDKDVAMVLSSDSIRHFTWKLNLLKYNIQVEQNKVYIISKTSHKPRVVITIVHSEEAKEEFIKEHSVYAMTNVFNGGYQYSGIKHAKSELHGDLQSSEVQPMIYYSSRHVQAYIDECSVKRDGTELGPLDVYDLDF